MTDSKTGILMYNMSVKDIAVLESKKMLKNNNKTHQWMKVKRTQELSERIFNGQNQENLKEQQIK